MGVSGTIRGDTVGIRGTGCFELDIENIQNTFDLTSVGGTAVGLYPVSISFLLFSSLNFYLLILFSISSSSFCLMHNQVNSLDAAESTSAMLR